LLHKLQFENITNLLSDWYTLGASNLLMGYLLVSKYQYPGLDEDFIRKELDKIKMEIWLELSPSLTALEKVKVFNKILFDVNKFEGDRKNYYSPLNSYINNVLESRKGNPLALSMLFIILADLVEVPIYGVNLPEHFILAYVDVQRTLTVQDIRKADVLFYINPFSGGAVFTKHEIEAFLKQMKVDPEDRYFQPCDNVEMIKRLLANLINAYNSTGNKVKAAELEILLKIFE
jgi:regulator of sirC expression with transglutaminase-like and TPR domain